MKQLLYGFATASLAAAALLSCQSTKVAEEPQPVQPPLMGWSSWNAYMVDISDSIIMHQADLMAQNGLKVDYCGGRNLNLDECERYSRIRTVIDSVANKPIRINVCRWAYPGTWVKNIGESWRMSEDIRPVWKSIRKIVFKNLYLSAYAGDGHYNDLDMLAVGYNIKPSPFWEEGLGLSYI